MAVSILGPDDFDFRLKISSRVWVYETRGKIFADGNEFLTVNNTRCKLRNGTLCDHVTRGRTKWRFSITSVGNFGFSLKISTEYSNRREFEEPRSR